MIIRADYPCGRKHPAIENCARCTFNDDEIQSTMIKTNRPDGTSEVQYVYQAPCTGGVFTPPCMRFLQEEAEDGDTIWKFLHLSPSTVESLQGFYILAVFFAVILGIILLVFNEDPMGLNLLAFALASPFIYMIIRHPIPLLVFIGIVLLLAWFL